MLANFPIASSCGRFADDVQLPDTARLELLDFIASELPRWRDHPDRPNSSAETVLTEHLCDHLNSAARWSNWSHVQFRTEISDDLLKGRKIDLTVKPCGAAIIIGGRRHTQFEMLFPIECKRLPIPSSKRRDEREYLISRHSSTGGIQRFKDGHHGGQHKFAAMIAFVQSGTILTWQQQISLWIEDLARQNSGWSIGEDLTAIGFHAGGVATYHSTHTRKGGLCDISVRHVWIVMEQGAA